jgi:hypothetical protein
LAARLGNKAVIADKYAFNTIFVALVVLLALWAGWSIVKCPMVISSS